MVRRWLGSSWVIVLPSRFFLLLLPKFWPFSCILTLPGRWRAGGRICLLIAHIKKQKNKAYREKYQRCRYFHITVNPCLIVHCCSKWRSESRKITVAACHFNCIYMCCSALHHYPDLIFQNSVSKVKILLHCMLAEARNSPAILTLVDRDHQIFSNGESSPSAFNILICYFSKLVSLPPPLYEQL